MQSRGKAIPIHAWTGP